MKWYRDPMLMAMFLIVAVGAFTSSSVGGPRPWGTGGSGPSVFTPDSSAKLKTAVVDSCEGDTFEEPLKWLRENGVNVETPSDRRQKAELLKILERSRADLDPLSPSARTFTYVYIPAADSEPLQLRNAVVHADERGDGDQLPNLLAPHFSAGKVDDTALRCSPYLKQLGGASVPPPSADYIKGMGGTTETFRLSAGAAGPVNDRVNLYLDEVGVLKKLPANKRAASLSAQCGFGAGVPFFGDIFVGRVRTDEGLVRNVNFALEDTRPNSPWLRDAAIENLAAQKKEAHLHGPGVQPEELTNLSGKGDGYTWQQDGEQVLVTVAVPAGTRGKHCKVKTLKDAVTVDLTPSAPTDSFKKLHLWLYAPVVASDSMWCLDEDSILLTLTKMKGDETWPVLTRV